MPRVDPEEYVELVLRCVEQVPRGRVTTYGAVAEVVGALVGGGGPRQVGSVMASYGGPVSWWRVVRADGRIVTAKASRQAALLRAEGVVVSDGRVVAAPVGRFAG